MKKYLKISVVIIGLAGSFGTGMIFERRLSSSKNTDCGYLRIDQSEADEAPKTFLELEVPIEYLQKMQRVSFVVINKNYI